MNEQAIAERRSIAEQIRADRKSVGISQRELALLAECSVATIANLESGLVPNRGQVLPRVLKTLADLQSGERHAEGAASQDDEGRPAEGAPVQESAGRGRYEQA
jgi:transcriptional regulator with XRE-family HTH domain